MRLPTILPTYRDADGSLPAYAWPGGYAIAYLVDDGEFICANCVNNPSHPVHDATEDPSADGWRVDGYMSADMQDEGEWACAHCYVVISGDPSDI